MTAPAGLPTREVPTGLTAEQALLLSTQQTYAAQQAALREQLAVALATIWAATTATPDFSPAAAAKFVAQILPITTGAQRAMAALTIAAMNQRIAPPRPITVPLEQVSGAPLRNGADPQVVYARPFKEIKWRLSQGKTLGQAVDAGLRRANSIAESDLQLAHTHTARRVLQQAATMPLTEPGGYLDRAREAHQRRLDEVLRRRGTRTPVRPAPAPPARDRGTVVGYRRVLGNNPNHCAMCLIASTQRYHIADLMPMHPGCHCTVQELWSGDGFDSDTQVLDPGFLQEIHNAVARDLGWDYVDAGGRGPASTTNTKGDLIAGYKNIIITNEHGELGPVLGIRGHDFTGPKDIPNLGHERVNPLVGDDGIPNLDAL